MTLSRAEEYPQPPDGKSGWPWTETGAQLADTMPDGSAWPMISIVTPSFNLGQYLEETIRSVLMQGYPNLEFIIIDGDSTDGSVAIIEKYEHWLSFWVSEADRGQGHAINKGIQKASGQILFWLNADDLCLPDAFHQVALAFNANPDVSMVIGQAQIINAEGNTIGELKSEFSSWEDLITTPINGIRQVSTFFSRELFDKLGLIDESLHIAMDTELLIRFTQFHRPLILNNYLSAYRLHSDAKSIKQIVSGFIEADKVRAKYIPNQQLAGLYRKRSATRWLKLSRSGDFDISKRMICILNVIKQQPQILLTRKFASALKKMLLDSWAPPVTKHGEQ